MDSSKAREDKSNMPVRAGLTAFDKISSWDKHIFVIYIYIMYRTYTIYYILSSFVSPHSFFHHIVSLFCLHYLHEVLSKIQEREDWFFTSSFIAVISSSGSILPLCFNFVLKFMTLFCICNNMDWNVMYSDILIPNSLFTRNTISPEKKIQFNFWLKGKTFPQCRG